MSSTSASRKCTPLPDPPLEGPPQLPLSNTLLEGPPQQPMDHLQYPALPQNQWISGSSLRSSLHAGTPSIAKLVSDVNRDSTLHKPGFLSQNGCASSVSPTLQYRAPVPEASPSCAFS
jgi:hypothetical protein